MTRTVVAVTTYRLRLTCDVCGLRLYTWQRVGLDRWLVGRGWVVGDEDYCPGCATKDEKETVDYRANV